MSGKKPLDDRLREKALELFRRLEGLSLPRFDGATVDFHMRKPTVIFLPDAGEFVEVKDDRKLLETLREHDVRRVLFDVLIPAKANLMLKVAEEGMETFVLRRPTALSGFKSMVGRKYGLNIPKDDFTDAVCLAYTWSKFHRRLDVKFLRCWPVMILWRTTEDSYRRQQQTLQHLPTEIREKMRRIMVEVEEATEETAKEFVASVTENYPINQLFEELGIADDTEACAYCCELFLESLDCKSFAAFLKKLGVGVPTKQDRQEDIETRKRRKPYIHDGRGYHALIQLTIKRYHIDPKKEKKKVKGKAIRTAEEIWTWKERCVKAVTVQPGGGNPERPALGKRDDPFIPARLRAGAPAKCGRWIKHTASGPQTPGWMTDR